MDENEMNNMEEDIIDFEDEDGNVIPFAVIDYVFYNGEEYALLTEVTEEEAEEENQECIVCRVVADTEEDGEETESFVPVEDETLAQKLVDIFNTKMADEEKDEDACADPAGCTVRCADCRVAVCGFFSEHAV